MGTGGDTTPAETTTGGDPMKSFWAWIVRLWFSAWLWIERREIRDRYNRLREEEAMLMGKQGTRFIKPVKAKKGRVKVKHDTK